MKKPVKCTHLIVNESAKKNEENISKIYNNANSRNLYSNQNLLSCNIQLFETILIFLDVFEMNQKFRLISKEMNKKYKKISIVFKKNFCEKYVPFYEITHGPVQRLILLPKFIQSISVLSNFLFPLPRQLVVVEYKHKKIPMFKNFLSKEYFEQTVVQPLLLNGRIDDIGTKRLQQVFQNFCPENVKYFFEKRFGETFFGTQWDKQCFTTAHILIFNNIIIVQLKHFAEYLTQLFFIDGEIFYTDEKLQKIYIFFKNQNKIISIPLKMFFLQVYRVNVEHDVSEEILQKIKSGDHKIQDTSGSEKYIEAKKMFFEQEKR